MRLKCWYGIHEPSGESIIPAVDECWLKKCKECKYLVNATVNDNGFLICDISDMEITPDDFCSYGERKDGGADND